MKFKSPRLTGWTLITLVLLFFVWLLAPQQVLVSLYKLSLVTLAAVIGYWLDRSLFPYARPSSFQDFEEVVWADSGEIKERGTDKSILTVAATNDLLFATSMLRRAMIVGCAMLAIGLGA